MAEFVWTPGTLVPNLAQAEAKAFAYMARTTAYWSLRAEAQARRGAKWTDRTGNARSGLNGSYTVSKSGGSATFTIVLAHSMSYGYWLETVHFAHKGDLSIILPTLYRGESPVSTQWSDMMAKVLERIFR